MKIVRVDYYKRSGFSYYSKVTFIYDNQSFEHSIYRKLDFISYWLIKFFQGNEKLKQMAADVPGEYYK